LKRHLYRIKVIDRENVPKEGGALLVSNHVSVVDALLILVSIQRPVRFLINRDIYHARFIHPVCRLARAIPILNKDKPKEIAGALSAATEAIRNGEVVCIFAEGQLTRTGNLLRFNKGLERIMKDVDCPIIPVHLDRIWGSIFSFEGGK